MTRPRRRLALLSAALASVVLIGDAALVKRALDGARAEARQEHQLVAERIFEELERELTVMVEREEERSFLEYRFFFLPERQVRSTVGLVRSPISEVDPNGIIVGYFQIDPDGVLYNPARPRDAELQFALDNDAFEGSPELDRIDGRLVQLTGGIDWNAHDHPVTADRTEPEEPEPVYEVFQELNRYSRDRPTKQAQRMPTASNAVANFTNEQNTAELIGQPQTWTPAPPADTVPLSSVGDGLVDVVVSPIRGVHVPGNVRVLFRTVRVGADIYRQGLVVDTDALTAHIEQIVLADSSARDVARLQWRQGPVDGASSQVWAPYQFSHRFAAPFDDLQAIVFLSEIPGAGGSQRKTLLILSAILAVVTIGGAGMLYRSVDAELEFAERRNNFVAAVSHELKTPLTAIRMYSEMLQEGFITTDEKRQQYYETITAESERLSRLINNVLELSRLEKGTRDVRITVGDLGPILEQSMAVLRPHVAQSGLSLRLQLAEGLPPVRVDVDALTQILVNLVDNAVKFSEAGDITIVAEPVGERVRVSVRDRGPGVPSRQLERIFEPFFRGERELTRRTKGTGIGLALVRGLADRMGAVVQAQNRPEGGLEVSVLLVVG